MYKYQAVVVFFDKHSAERTVRKVVQAKNKKEAERMLNNLGKIKEIIWETVPVDNMDDNQLELV